MEENLPDYLRKDYNPLTDPRAFKRNDPMYSTIYSSLKCNGEPKTLYGHWIKQWKDELEKIKQAKSEENDKEDDLFPSVETRVRRILEKDIYDVDNYDLCYLEFYLDSSTTKSEMQDQALCLIKQKSPNFEDFEDSSNNTNSFSDNSASVTNSDVDVISVTKGEDNCFLNISQQNRLNKDFRVNRFPSTAPPNITTGEQKTIGNKNKMKKKISRQYISIKRKRVASSESPSDEENYLSNKRKMMNKMEKQRREKLKYLINQLRILIDKNSNRKLSQIAVIQNTAAFINELHLEKNNSSKTIQNLLNRNQKLEYMKASLDKKLKMLNKSKKPLPKMEDTNRKSKNILH